MGGEGWEERHGRRPVHRNHQEARPLRNGMGRGGVCVSVDRSSGRCTLEMLMRASTMRVARID